MLAPTLAASLRSGQVVVTPNKRLARRLIALHDAVHQQSGAATWPAALAMPWTAWLQSLWLEALEADASPAGLRLLAPVEAGYLWERLVAADAAVRAPLLDARGMATLAAEAWQLVHAWGAGGESWRAWPDGTAPDSDPETFAAWAEGFRRELARIAAIDLAQLPDVLARVAPQVPRWRDRSVVFAGFLEQTPQQQRLRSALADTGMQVVDVPSAHRAATATRRASAATPRDELRTALAWARRQAQQAPKTVIGIAIEDFAQRREEVRALAEEVLCPALQLPGHETAPRPFDLSLGTPLAQVPVVATALDVLALAHGRLSCGAAAALLRSAYVAGTPERRAPCERLWLEEGRKEVGWNDAIAAMATLDAALALRWRRARDALRAEGTAARSPRQWAVRWRNLLEAAGWPGDRVPVSAEAEARNAWEELLETFARIGSVVTELAAAPALATLRGLAEEQVFQPETPAAPIQIMGLLEAAGLPFDALWVAGLSAERWPAAPQPNPFLPLRWQRERRVPRSSAARELEYARMLTAALTSSADVVVLSHASTIDDYASAPSALIDPALPWYDAGVLPPRSARCIAAGAPRLEAVADERAPPLADAGATRGGTDVIADQGDCPFRATGRFRLGAEPWPRAAEGLDYRERGKLVHATQAAFWHDVQSHATLLALDEDALHVRIAAAVDVARAGIPAARWRLLPAAIAATEAQRLVELTTRWLERYERPRPPFQVTTIETATTLTLAGVTLRLRIDRVDSLPDGGRVIIDYKTGDVDGPKTWFGVRPRAPQLGLYALAMRAEAPAVPLRGVAYAKLKAGELRALGLAADTAAWPELTDVAQMPTLVAWPAVERWWQQHLTAIAAELRDGVATVTPRDHGAPCKHCGLQPLCRIGAVGLSEVGERDDD